MKMTATVFAAIAGILVLVACAGFSTAGDRIDMISVAELKSALPDRELTVIDVRDPKGWASSTEKIPGAIREDPEAVPMWISKYDPTDRLVLYCA